MSAGRLKVNSGVGAAVIGPGELHTRLMLPALRRRRSEAAVLFDLDGVLVDTAEFHFKSWLKLARELGLPFDRTINEGFRGVGRMECLDKLLGPHRGAFAAEEKQLLADRKNAFYLEQVSGILPGDLEPGVVDLFASLRAAHYGIAVVSASKNARLVLQKLGIVEWLDAIVDGTMVNRSKPDPQGFLIAARKVGLSERACVVVEDAEAGVRAGITAGMKTIGIGATNSPAAQIADVHVPHVSLMTVGMADVLCGKARGRELLSA